MDQALSLHLAQRHACSRIHTQWCKLDKDYGFYIINIRSVCYSIMNHAYKRRVRFSRHSMVRLLTFWLLFSQISVSRHCLSWAHGYWRISFLKAARQVKSSKTRLFLFQVNGQVLVLDGRSLVPQGNTLQLYLCYLMEEVIWHQIY